MITSFCKSMCDFSFRGRSTRKEFLYFLISTITISLLLLTVIFTIGITILGLKIDSGNVLSMPRNNMNAFGMICFIIMNLLLGIYCIFAIWSAIMGGLLAIRRLHDINYSGVCYWIWVSALILLSVNEMSVLTMFLIYFIFSGILILVCAKSFPTTNKYGKVDIEELALQINKQNG